MFFILVDAYSKWLEVVPMSAANSTTTIECLRSIFATHGLPKVFVTDNGSQFTSVEFEKFMENNGIRHLRSPPYHPSTNGLAERSVQTFKRAMEKNKDGSISTRVARFLFSFRRTPHSTTGLAPAELLLGRIPRSHLDLIKPSISTKLKEKQFQQKKNFDVHAKQRSFKVGDSVFVRDLPARKDWLACIITSVNGPLSYLVTLDDSRIVRRHVDHIRSRSSTTSVPPSTFDLLAYPPSTGNYTQPDSQPAEELQPQVTTQVLRRSARSVVQPDRYGFPAV